MNLKGMQAHRLLAALGACLAALLVAGPAAARPYDEGGTSTRSALEAQSVVSSTAIVNQRQLELAADRQTQVIPYLSHGILEAEQAWEVIPYLSHGVLTASDADGLAAQNNTPDGYQPQLGARSTDLAGSGSRADRPDGYQPQLGVSDFGVVADDGVDWTTTGFAASIIAALLVALAITFTRGNRHGYRSA